jgi:hypothetical protein
MKRLGGDCPEAETADGGAYLHSIQVDGRTLSQRIRITSRTTMKVTACGVTVIANRFDSRTLAGWQHFSPWNGLLDLPHIKVSSSAGGLLSTL